MRGQGVDLGGTAPDALPPLHLRPPRTVLQHLSDAGVTDGSTVEFAWVVSDASFLVGVHGVDDLQMNIVHHGWRFPGTHAPVEARRRAFFTCGLVSLFVYGRTHTQRLAAATPWKTKPLSWACSRRSTAASNPRHPSACRFSAWTITEVRAFMWFLAARSCCALTSMLRVQLKFIQQAARKNGRTVAAADAADVLPPPPGCTPSFWPCSQWRAHQTMVA